jgi:DNA-binding response OmpR family regulator
MRTILLVADDDAGMASALRQLGAEVELVKPYDDVHEIDARVVVVMAGDRPDLAVSALRHVRKTAGIDAGSLVALPERQVARLEPSAGFDDFVVVPCSAVELYARIRQIEWKKSEFTTEERVKVGPIVIDHAAHEVTVEGRRVVLTAKEFALLVCFVGSRGRVLSRDVLLARVWGRAYSGGARTVDIHVRRLRAKLGESLPLETLRGAGYLLRSPDGSGGSAKAKKNK